MRASIGYLPESTPLYTEMMVLEYLEFMAQMRGLKGDPARKAIKKVVEATMLGEVIGKEIRTLSKGFRQRVGIAQALVHEPPVLILDEPMSGLDPNQAIGIRDLIREIGKERTVILSTHNLAEVQVTCQRVLIIARGRIVADDTPEALSRQGGRRYVVHVDPASVEAKASLRGSKTALTSVFSGIAGIDTVREASPAADGARVFDLVASASADLRAAIFRAAVDAGLVLVELRSKGENLEQVFRELTTTAAPAAGSTGSDEDDEDDEDDDDDEDEETK